MKCNYSLKNIYFFLIISFSALFATGCSTHHGVTIQKFGSPPQNYKNGASFLIKGIDKFTVSPGDVYRVEIRPVNNMKGQYKIETDSMVRLVVSFGSGDYHLMVGDKIEVDFVTDSSLNFEAIIRPDGKITIPRIGEVTAEGKTTQQLAKNIAAVCIKKVNNPKVTIALTGMNKAPLNDINGDFKISPDGNLIIPRLGEVKAAGLTPQELSRKLSSLARKKFQNNIKIDVIPRNYNSSDLVHYDRVVTVTPSGEIMLPLIGNIKVANYTLPEVKNKLLNILKNYYVNPVDISFTLISSAKRIIYVGGEVKIPGPYPLADSMTLIKAIMVAGGTTPEGDLNNVILLHYNNRGELTIFRSNLKEVIDHNQRYQDIALAPQDVVYVPKTGVSKANQFIDQYIKRMIPFNSNLNYNINNPAY